jgi:alpha-glucosidase
MRYVRAALISGVIACSGAPRDAFQGGPPAPPLDDGGTPPAPAVTCGDAPELPDGVARDDATSTLTVTCSGAAKLLVVTPYADGIVRLRYGEDDRGSIVPIDRPPPIPLRAGRRSGSAIVCTPELELAIAPGDCRLVAKDVATGTTVLEDGDGGGYFEAQATAYGETAPRDVHGVVRASPAGERLYGLGLHTAVVHGLDLRGQTIELWNTDAYDATGGGFKEDGSPVYESIPFYAGLRDRAAYGVFLDDTHRSRFDLASDGSHVKVSAWGGAIDEWVFAGPTLKDVVRRYTSVTGRAPLPPPWALGYLQSRWEGPCDGAPADKPFCSATQIADVVKRFSDVRMPLDGVFLDIQHMDAFRSFTFDAARFPDPDAFVAGLEAQGVHVSTIVDPGIKVDPAYYVYSAGIADGHFLSFEGQVWPGAAVFPDFSRDKTRSWWSDLVATEAKHGVRGMWIDMNEPSSFGTGTVPDAVTVDGNGRPTSMADLHDAYAWFEAKATRAGMLAARPTERPFVLSRAAFAGQQRFSAVWTGDAPSTWGTVQLTLGQLLELGMSGIAFAGSDVGGYSGRTESTADLFTRWMALGAISPLFRAHAEKDARRQEPWAFGNDAEDAVRELIGMRYELLPYMYSAFDEASRTGAPVLRPLVFEFQDDEPSRTVGDEAMLGPSLLVAPIVDPSATKRSVYLPPGDWFELRSGAAYVGGASVLTPPQDQLPNDALPIFARAGAIVPRADRALRTADARTGALTFDVFPPAPSPTTFTLLEDDGLEGGASARTTLTNEKTATGTRLSAAKPEGAYAAKHTKRTLRFVRVDHAPSAVVLDGQPLAGDAWRWDPIDRAVSVMVPDRPSFVVEVLHDGAREAEGTVAVPIAVTLPASTPADATIAIASSATSWTHVPLTRSGAVATGTIVLPRGGWAFFKVTRGGWPTVEKDAACGELANRHVFGAPARPVAISVAAWADRCP